MNLVSTINTTYVNNTNGFSYFSHITTVPGQINYYINEDYGMSVYSSNWTFITRLNTTIPTNGQMVIVNNNIYISGDSSSYFIKLNASNLALVKNNTIESKSELTNGIYWSVLDGKIFAPILTNHSQTEVCAYDLNLNKTLAFNISNFDTNGDNPTAVNYFKNNYYIGYSSGKIRITMNNNTFSACPNDTAVNSIQLDVYGNMLTTCLNSQSIYIYSSNGTYTRSFNTTDNARLTYAGLDQTGRVIAIAMNLNRIFMFY